MIRQFKRAEQTKLIGDDIESGRITEEQAIAKIRTRFLARQPFWGTLLAPIRVFIVDDTLVPTAATDSEFIYWGRKFLYSLTYGEASFIFGHEGMHIAFNHIWRLHARNPRLWNIACDHFINLILDDEADRAPEVFAKPDFARIRGNPDADYYHDSRFKDLAAETIYAILMREGYQDSEQMETDEANNGIGGDLNYSKAAEGDELQSEKAKRLQDQWNKRLAQATEAGRKAGNVPGSMARWVKELAQPKVDWQTLLSSYLAFNPMDYEFTHPDRRYTDWPFVVPDLDGDKLDAYAVIDTSGSISNDMIRQFITELYNIIAMFGHVQGTLIGHDHEVHDVIEFSKSEPPESFTGGGGGTDFHCVIREIEKHDKKPQVLIWFTDLYSNMIANPGFPVIFVAVDTPLDGPDWAHTVHLETR